MILLQKPKNICALLIAAVMLFIMSVPLAFTGNAVSLDYPAQLVRISTSDNSRNLNISGYSDKSLINTWTTNGSQNENWQLRYTGKDSNGSFFKIVNMGTGRLLTPNGYSAENGTKAVIFGDESDKSQHWYINAVSKDSGGRDLCYKITNYIDPSMALTYNSGDNTVTLSPYSGDSSQQWLINTSGVQGFAGYCKDNGGNVKASITGGLLGETVEVSTFDELKAACMDDTPRTIIITSDISKTGAYTTDSNGRYQFKDARIYIRPNKTIIGSYNAHSLYNVYFCTYDREDYGLGENIIIRNIEISHDKELNNDNVWDFKYGENFWIDHCTFVGHSGVNTASTGQDDWDKFLCFYDDADYITISDCTFGLHEYGLLLGQPTDNDETLAQYEGKPYITLADNYFKDCLTRAPGLLRYGYFHSLNNYVVNFNLGYTIHTACKLYAEACYYDGGTGKGSVVNDDATQITEISSGNISKAIPYYTDVNSKAVNCYRDNNLGNLSSNKLTSWKPSNNYSYTAKTADEAKDWTTANAGAQSQTAKMTYAMFAESGVPSAGYTSKPEISMNEDPTEPPTEPPTELPTEPIEGAVISEDMVFMLKNSASGLYMEVADGIAANAANVQQWGENEAYSHNSWKVKSAGDGYYYIYSQLGDGKTYLLDIDCGKTENGTNIAIYENTYSDAQLFKFAANEDGSYRIVTKVSNDTSCVEVKDGSSESGANIQEWELNGHDCQNWIIEEVKQKTLAGDVNFDSTINVFDVIIMQRKILSGETAALTNKDIAAMDLNGDGSINSADVVLMNEFLVKKINSFPAGIYSEY